MMATRSKYSPEVLIPMFRRAAKLRKSMMAVGFTDNGGAIHSAERILDILGQRLKYPSLSHVNNLKKHEFAEFSKKAWQANQRGKRVLIEHVSPLRALTQAAIKQVEDGASDHELMRFVRRRYRLVLLTEEETSAVNKKNRTRISSKRLSGIRMRKVRAHIA